MKLCEFDTNKEAMINAWDILSPLENCPKTVVTCFANNLIEEAKDKYHGEIIGYVGNANAKFPLYLLNNGIGLIMTPVGAPSAVGLYEELYVLGVENIVVFGTCGVLVNEIKDCSIIIPEYAIRDEGTSYHYEVASDEIEVNKNSMDMMKTFFTTYDIDYTIGKVWTTDAFYRETKDKVLKRKQEGAICVDMECSAFSALAKFRNKRILQFFYSADNLDHHTWDKRSLANEENLESKIEIMDIAILLAKHIK